MLPPTAAEAEPEPTANPASPPAPPAPLRSPWRAWAEIVLCSGYPTQIMLGEALKDAGIAPLNANGSLSATFVFALSLGDTAVLVALMLWLLIRNGEQPRQVFFGTRRAGEEAVVGLLSVPFVVAMVLALTLVIRAVAPSLRNVPENPLAGLLGTQTGLLAFLVVVIVAGGLREELQRAFLLHRFSHDLGSTGAGLLITSVAFGLGHTLQGWDAAILTGALGAAWGAIYLTRGSAVASIVSHSLFNCGELLRAFLR
ncbi:MAG: type II CAAX endopeptidase family protein [Vicinamibacterales bacterium]